MSSGAEAIRPAQAVSGKAKPPVTPRRWAVRVSAFAVLSMLIGLIALCAAACGAIVLARYVDSHQAVERRAAVVTTVEGIRSLAKDPDTITSQFIHILEQAAGLNGLKVESDPSDPSRETYPLLDNRGRIIGFLTWDHENAMTATVERLMPFAAALALCLLGFALLSLWQLRRARAQARCADDPVTQLPGHDCLLERIGEWLKAKAEGGFTLALIELDGAEDAMETLGPRGGDVLIASVAERLKKTLPMGAICGRFGAYQFAVLLGADLEAGATLRAMVEAVSRPHWIDTVIKLGAHASQVQAPRDGGAVAELVRRVGIALRAAKRKGPGTIVTFDPAIDAEHNDAQLIKRELAGALASQALELHYQPIVAASGGRIVGVEALLRWTHATRGAIPPAVFVPIAEQMGLMDALGEFVLRRALADAARWPELYVAINLSPLQARDHGIVAQIRGLTGDAKVAPERVVLEITEGVLIDNPDEMKERLAELRALGVRIALDDFGSGYSNLSYLRTFPFDKLKIDRGFVGALGQSSNGGVIIQAIVALGRALGMSVLAEGVETEEQRVLLRLAGCDEMQGYRFARPAPVAVIDKLLSGQKTATAAIA
ncbi:MAG TPA: bifunctional diguanylate cyclase/phosphodiesterase [Pseudolabrys sp.]|nr:bifunctional diguanylate cyclase/phosphodiesterase [Pseudolabrys sp.]